MKVKGYFDDINEKAEGSRYDYYDVKEKLKSEEVKSACEKCEYGICGECEKT